MRFCSLCLVFVAFSCLIAYQPSAPVETHLTDPFAPGWMLADTNGDGVIDYVAGKIVVPTNPTAAENAAAADVAARLGFSTTGFTPPIVISADEDRRDGARIYIGRAATSPVLLAPDEGAVFAIDQNLGIAGYDDAGLLAAAEAYAARAPYIWRVPGERLATISSLTAIVYAKGQAGIARAVLAPGQSSANLETTLNNLASVHELVAGSATAISSKPLAAIPSAPAPAATETPEAENGPAHLDLATLYTMRGLFRGTPRMPIPSNLDSQLYVPAGRAGIAMANLAARMGLETTGITIPLATPAPNAAARDIRTKSVLAEGSAVATAVVNRLREQDRLPESPLAVNEGELRVVDRAFGRNDAVLIRGDVSGQAAARALASDHLPKFWEPRKQFL